MHTKFTLGDIVSKQVQARQLREKPLRLEQQSMEGTSGQKVIHVESFNEVFEALNKVYDEKRTDWDLRVLVVLWAYRTMCKKLVEQKPPRLEYGVNAVIPIEYKMPSPHIAALVDMTAHGALEEWIA